MKWILIVWIMNAPAGNINSIPAPLKVEEYTYYKDCMSFGERFVSDVTNQGFMGGFSCIPNSAGALRQLENSDQNSKIRPR